MWRRVVLIWLIGLSLGAIVFVYAVNRYVFLQTKDKAQNSITEIPIEEPQRIAIVFGASVRGNGEPSPALDDRIITAVELYRAGRVRKILMSGDNSFENYNEPAAMREQAIKRGVPAENVVADFAGRRTYDTCYRAKEIFGVERAVLVTHEFHLNRAIYLCQAAGIDSVGITADRRRYDDSTRRAWAWRETFAVVAAWFDVNFLKPTPILGNKELIEP
ncbi:MAG TPA: ElyC/SanA/YdcF family protein [Pyrinomonadaceae bacterium]|jgi:vancomycin permeability regulator SanA